MSDADIEALKERTVEAFAPVLEKWLRECNGDRRQEFVALASWFGHALGSSAFHLGLHDVPRIAVSAGELVAEHMAEDLAAQTWSGEWCRPTKPKPSPTSPKKTPSSMKD